MAALSPTISPAGHNEFKYKLTKLFFYVSACYTGLKGHYASAFYVSFYVSFYMSSSCVFFYVSSTNRQTQYYHKQYITKFTVCSYIIY